MNLSEILNRFFETISLGSSKVVYFLSWLGLLISGLTAEQITGGVVAGISVISMIVAGILNYKLKVRLIRIAESNLNNQDAHELFLEQTRE